MFVRYVFGIDWSQNLSDEVEDRLKQTGSGVLFIDRHVIPPSIIPGMRIFLPGLGPGEITSSTSLVSWWDDNGDTDGIRMEIPVDSSLATPNVIDSMLEKGWKQY